MSKFMVKFEDVEQQENNKTVNTDGFLFVYINEANQLVVNGKFDFKVLMPLVAKFIMDRVAKQQ